jgi:hypothetical protein
MLTTEALRASSYEGWVAWVNGQPIFEAVPLNPRLAQLAPGAATQMTRQPGRNVMDWDDVPNERIDLLEVYFDRGFRKEQPALMIAKNPGADLCFFQMKTTGMVVNVGVLAHAQHRGQERTGVHGYRIGYFDRKQNFSMMWEVQRGVWQPKEYPIVGHPCWPRPHGYGLNPTIMGLTESDVPSVPVPGDEDGKGLIAGS